MNRLHLMLAREIIAYESMLLYQRMGVREPIWRYVL